MRIFNNLVDSYRNKNYTEFEELCKSSLIMDIDVYIHLIDLLESVPDVSHAYDMAMVNHPEWAKG